MTDKPAPLPTRKKPVLSTFSEPPSELPEVEAPIEQIATAQAPQPPTSATVVKRRVEKAVQSEANRKAQNVRMSFDAPRDLNERALRYISHRRMLSETGSGYNIRLLLIEALTEKLDREEKKHAF